MIVLVDSAVEAVEARRLLLAAHHRLGAPVEVAHARIVVLGSGGVTTGHLPAVVVGEADADVVTGLYTLDDAARLLRTSESTVKRLVAAGELPAVHIGRAVRIRPGDLVAYVDGLPTGRNQTTREESP